MTTVKEWIDELNVKMSETEKHITRCERALVFKKQNNDTNNLKPINDNLDKALKRKKLLHNEIVGMVDYEDRFGSDTIITDAGWERFIPARLKGDGRWVDHYAPSLAQEYGFEDNDFRYPFNC